MPKVRTIAAGRHEKKRGSARMKEFGYKQVQLNLDDAERRAINAAARRDGKRLATWIREMAFLVATGPEYTKPRSQEL